MHIPAPPAKLTLDITPARSRALRTLFSLAALSALLRPMGRRLSAIDSTRLDLAVKYLSR